MTCSSDAVSPKTLEVYWSSDDNTYTELSGEFAAVDNPEQSRITGEAYGFGCDTAYTGVGPREPIEIGFTILYTETAAEPFKALHPYFTNGSQIYLIYYPKGSAATGGGSGYKAHGYLTNWGYPGADADSGDPILCSGTLRTNEVTVV